MKKVLYIALFLLMLPLTASAATGDVVGNIYSTDIRAFINDIEVESYAIDGKTVVIVEDVLDNTQYIYNDDERQLSILSFDIKGINEGRSQATSYIGDVVGNIYETDIKTTIYDMIVPSYCLDGKTAVAIEDLAYDSVYSPWGASYLWNGEERTLKLEFMYDNRDIIPDNLLVHIDEHEILKHAEATFEEIIHCGGGTQVYHFSGNVRTSADAKVLLPIVVQTDGSSYEGIGYYLQIPSQSGVTTTFTYYHPNQLERFSKNYTPAKKTIDSVIEHFQSAHYSTLIKRYDTEEYTFAHLCMAFTSGSSNYLIQIYKDGTCKDYLDGMHNTKRSVRDLTIDEENQKVTFRYEDRYTSDWYTNYEIDLKTGTMKEI